MTFLFFLAYTCTLSLQDVFGIVFLLYFTQDHNQTLPKVSAASALIVRTLSHLHILTAVART